MATAALREADAADLRLPPPETPCSFMFADNDGADLPKAEFRTRIKFDVSEPLAPLEGPPQPPGTPPQPRNDEKYDG